MKKWVNDLKFAIIEEDIDKIMLLSEHIPQTEDTELASEACALIEQAIAMAQREKVFLSGEMAKLRNAKKYLG